MKVHRHTKAKFNAFSARWERQVDTRRDKNGYALMEILVHLILTEETNEIEILLAMALDIRRSIQSKKNRAGGLT
jgi:hypothetical protein